MSEYEKSTLPEATVTFEHDPGRHVVGVRVQWAEVAPAGHSRIAGFKFKVSEEFVKDFGLAPKTRPRFADPRILDWDIFEKITDKALAMSAPPGPVLRAMIALAEKAEEEDPLALTLAVERELGPDKMTEGR